MVALGECVDVEWALVIACFMACRIHSWSYSTMFVPCEVCGALMSLDEKTMSYG
jgi:hypothetical protein